MTDAYPITAVNRAKRLHERATCDHATIHARLDASMLRHIAYVVDGQPCCTPTLFWREGTRLYWRESPKRPTTVIATPVRGKQSMFGPRAEASI